MCKFVGQRPSTARHNGQTDPSSSYSTIPASEMLAVREITELTDHLLAVFLAPFLFKWLSVICQEFSRVVGKDYFYDALDRVSPSFMDLLRKKKGLTGQLLAAILCQTKSNIFQRTEPIDVWCLCLQRLLVKMIIFKTCSDPADKHLHVNLKY